MPSDVGVASNPPGYGNSGKKFRWLTLFMGVIFCFVNHVNAAGTTSAAFLQLGSGARASGMGDAFTSVADDASSTYWNPAGMSLLSKKELLAEHDLHFQDISVERLAYVHPFASGGTIGAGTRSSALGVSAAYLHLDGIEARSGNTASADHTFGASDLAAALSYSCPLSERGRFSSSLGLTAKFIQQRIDNFQASAYALDIGVVQQAGPLRLGAVLANVGTSVRFINESYPLPQTVKVGLSYQPKQAPLTVAFGLEDVKGEGSLAYRLGTEYNMADLLSFRLGYLLRPGPTNRALKGSALGTVSDSELNKVTGLVGGVGFRLFGYGVDYAFTPYGELGNTHKISVSARFK